MSKLNFSFPIIRDIEATRSRHLKTIDKLKFLDRNGIGVLYDLNEDDLYDSVMHANYQLLMHYMSSNWDSQKGVKVLKSLVNSHFRNLIIDYLSDNGLPRSWDTAYYLLHQKEIDKMMKAVTKLIHAELS